MNLLKYFNNYLSSIEYIENINTIIFHNIIYENYISGKLNVKVKNDIYQSLLSFLFDGYYIEKNENAQQLMLNLPESYLYFAHFLKRGKKKEKLNVGI